MRLKIRKRMWFALVVSLFLMLFVVSACANAPVENQTAIEPETSQEDNLQADQADQADQEVEAEEGESDVWSDLNLSEEELKYLQMLKDKGQLDIAIRELSGVYTMKKDVESGFHYMLIKRFADDLGIDLNMKLVNFSDYWADENGDTKRAVNEEAYAYTPALLNEVDIYCDNLTILPWREKLVRFIEIYPFREVIVKHNDVEIAEATDLHGKRIVIQPDMSYHTTLQAYEEEIGISMEYIYVDSIHDTLPLVSAFDADATMFDSHRAFLEVSKYDNLTVSKPISDVLFIGWGVSKDNEVLATIMEKYIDHLKSGTEFEALWVEDYKVPFIDYLKLLAD